MQWEGKSNFLSQDIAEIKHRGPRAVWNFARRDPDD
jgi:hypothetical protein